MARALITKEEGTRAFQALDAIASQSVEDSKDALNKAIIALNKIREDGLFIYGGYEDWNSYLVDWRAHHGVSRGLVYGRLRVARLAKSTGFTDEDLEIYGVDTLGPYYETNGPITAYNRRTGEIVEVNPRIEQRLPEGDNLNERFGNYVREKVEAGEPPSLVRHRLDDDMEKLKITFMSNYRNMEIEGLTWIREEGDKYDDGFIRLIPEGPVPEDVELEFLKLLRIPTEWRE